MELADMIFENLVEEFSSEMVGKGVHEELLDYEWTFKTKWIFSKNDQSNYY